MCRQTQLVFEGPRVLKREEPHQGPRFLEKDLLIYFLKWTRASLKLKNS
jgi:hypothetical protein